MIHLFNNELDVAILDPVTDRDRLGPRYCTGGLLYQVSDRALGPLLAAPEYPSDHPSVINGQGAPEVFQHTLYYNPNTVPEKKLIIGVGLVENSRNFTNLQSHFTSNVDRLCTWETEMSDTRLETRAYQQYEEWSLSLWRIMVLEGRMVLARAAVHSQAAWLEGTAAITLHSFPRSQARIAG